MLKTPLGILCTGGVDRAISMSPASCSSCGVKNILYTGVRCIAMTLVATNPSIHFLAGAGRLNDQRIFSSNGDLHMCGSTKKVYKSSVMTPISSVGLLIISRPIKSKSSPPPLHSNGSFH